MSGASASAAPADLPGGAGWRRLRLRIALLCLGALALPVGLYAGLWRLGWELPLGAGVAELHGPLMIPGLFGTLISLERAVALGRDWPYAAPVLAIAGSFLLMAGLPPALAVSCFVVSAAILVAASSVILMRQPALFTATLLFGAIALLVGDVLWLSGSPLSDVTGWWLAFLVLTVAGERLELSRMLQPRPGTAALFLLAMGLLAAGARNRLADVDGAILFGLGLLACSAWLLRHDVALRGIRQSGQTRFSAVSMVFGLVWLGMTGAALVTLSAAGAPIRNDFALHMITIGFVLSMVFGHALIILPAVTGLRTSFHPAMYGPLGLLQAAAGLRAVGDAADIEAVRLCSGPLTVVALVAFAACVAIAARGAARRAGPATP
jgi:hypothetical protein